MKKLVFASMRKSAGKTSIILGAAGGQLKNYGYMKPFGDRLLYRKKRLWDYDSAIANHFIGQTCDPENITLGLEHSKLRYMYDEQTTKTKLVELADIVSKGKEGLLIESGRDITYGASVHLDALSIARYLDAKLVVVVNGDSEIVLDDIVFIKKRLNLTETDLFGIVINKVNDPDDFAASYLPAIKEMGIKVLGIVPYAPELSHATIGYLAEVLLAKVLTGETGMDKIYKSISVGAMSVDAVLRKEDFKREGKIVITSGDRSDMILASIQTNSAAVILTNNILPPSNIISRAIENNVPLLLVDTDTFQTAKTIEEIEPLITKEEKGKFKLLSSLVNDHIKFQ